MSSDSESDDYVAAPVSKKKQPKVEDVYKKTNLRDHILARPDSYIGTLEHETEKLFLVDSTGRHFEQRTITYVPGLFKIFDEILVNAADNKQRDPTGMTLLEVDINQSKNIISVYNNGKGIPIEMHNEYKVYVPQLIFGQLLTSSNYNDDEKRTVGGRNGFGAKLTNIYSTKFTVETCDGKNLYTQVFRNNMAETGQPTITKVAKTRAWTRITFEPDLKRFNLSTLTDDMVALLQKRTYDIAGTSGGSGSRGLKVFFNGNDITIKDFKTYCEMHLAPGTDLMYEQINDRWEVAIAPTDGTFQQVSFVNRINTLQGGTHVNVIADQCIATLTECIKKKDKKVTTLRPQHVKGYLWVFVNSLVENPSFNTQTKVTLTTKKTAFGGPAPQLSEAFNKKLSKSSLVTSIMSFAQFQQNSALKKTDAKTKTKRLLGIPKLEDANKAGTAESPKCTLIITEGDSAKALAMSGLSVVGRDYYGVFPIRGKLLNVREANTKQIVDNQEITYLKQIIGLQQSKQYTDTKVLRYGHIMIMTDQDHDGSHIKGLIINMFATFWPSLLKMPGFLTEFITPIVKVSRKRDNFPFYTIPEYETWREQHNEGKGWSIKYYKGLGTSTAAEARIYFTNIASHQIPFKYKDERCEKLIEMAFAKNSNERKLWIEQFVPGTYLSHAVSSIPYQDFINKELILYTIASNERAIPCLVDGLKPGQRKVLFSCFKRKLNKELKVAQLAGYVAEQSAYHHGEQSLAATIVTLAQNYVGSNNINYLWPSGQFGTRAQGGKDAASARYIFTYLSPITRTLFHPQDDPLLNYLSDDGQSIEPTYYVPVIPTVLVNGSSGIGTGWSSDIYNHNPREIIANIRRMLHGDEPHEMHPYYKGFIGAVVGKQGKRHSYTIRGLVDIVDERPNTVHVYELPVGKWTGDYKAWLEELSKEGHVTELMEYHTDVTVSFSITFSDATWKTVQTQGLRSYLKLDSSCSATNMVLFDANGKLRKYESTTEILKDFYDVRHKLYYQRKEYLITTISDELDKIDNKVRFILCVINEEIKLRNIKRADLLQSLEKLQFRAIYPKVGPDVAGGDAAVADEKNDDDDDVDDDSDDDDDDSDSDDEMTSASQKNRKPAATIKGGRSKKSTSTSSTANIIERLKGYTYLTSLPLMSLTYEKVQELLKEKKQKEDELALIKSKSIADMWSHDLDELSIALDAHEERERAELRAGENAHYSKSSSGGRRLGGSKRDDSDDEWGGSSKKKSTSKKAKEVAIPSWVAQLQAKRPKEQRFEIEQETEQERKKREKQEAKLASKANDVAAMLGIDFGEDGGDTPTPGSSQTTAAKKAPATKRATKSTTPKSTTARSKKAVLVSDESDFMGDTSDDDDDDDIDYGSDQDSEDESYSRKTAPKAKAATKKTPAAVSSRSSRSSRSPAPSMDEYDRNFIASSESEPDTEDDGSDSETEPAPKAKSRKAAAAAAPAVAKKATKPRSAASSRSTSPVSRTSSGRVPVKRKFAISSDSSNDDGDDDDDDDESASEEEISPIKKPRATKTASSSQQSRTAKSSGRSTKASTPINSDTEEEEEEEVQIAAPKKTLSLAEKLAARKGTSAPSSSLLNFLETSSSTSKKSSSKKSSIDDDLPVISALSKTFTSSVLDDDDDDDAFLATTFGAKSTLKTKSKPVSKWADSDSD